MPTQIDGSGLGQSIRSSSEDDITYGFHHYSFLHGATNKVQLERCDKRSVGEKKCPFACFWTEQSGRNCKDICSVLLQSTGVVH